MSDRGTNEAEQVKRGLAENDESPWEWGNYIERRAPWGWMPLVYGEHTYESAKERHRDNERLASHSPGMFRNPRLVRRAVSPWEVRDHE